MITAGRNIWVTLPRVLTGDFMLHLLLSVVIAVLPSPAILIPIIILLLVYFYKRNLPVQVLVVSIYALCCKSESNYYAFALVFSILSVLDKRKIQPFIEREIIVRRFKWFLGYMLFLYVFQFFVEGSLLSLPFFLITFFSPVLIMFYVWRSGLTSAGVHIFFRHLILIAIAQVIVALVFQAIPAGISAILARPTLGDVVAGNTGSPNSLAFLLIISVIPFLIALLFYRKHLFFNEKALTVFLLVLFIAMVFLNDAKSLYYSFILAVAVIIIIRTFVLGKKNGRKLFLVLTSVIIGILVSTFITTKVNETLEKYDEYIYGKYNFKWQYYLSAFGSDTRPSYQYILGTGPGTNGSRSANALAYDVLYKKENTMTLPKFIPAKSNQFTKQYLSKYFTQEYADASGERSAILGNPFNSICAMFVEFGVVGMILFLIFLFSVFSFLVKRNDYLAMMTAMVLIVDFINAFVDQTFEKPMQMHFTYLLIGFSFIKEYMGKELPLNASR